MRAFAETTPIRALVASKEFAFVATAHGVHRWHLNTRAASRLPQPVDQPSSLVHSMAYDEVQQQLWIASSTGITRYLGASAKRSDLPPPGKVLGVKSYKDSVMVPDRRGGIWIGLKNGLFYSDARGKWTNTGVKAAVTALHLDSQNTLWIGTKDGITWVNQRKNASLISSSEGCEFSKVLSLAEYGSGILVVAEGETAGETRIALAGTQGCITYEVPSGKKWLGSVRLADATYVLGSRELYEVSVPRAREGEAAVKPGFTLPARARGREVTGPVALRFEEVEQAVPKGASHIAGGGDFLMVGTQQLGTLIWKPGEINIGWLRNGDLTTDAEQLSVACSSKSDCFIATGTNKLWHWNGKVFSNEGDQRRVHAVVSLRDGRLLALREAVGPGHSGRAAIALALYKDGKWDEISGIRVETPGKEAQLKAAREGPGGLVWLALSYKQGRRRTVPFGVAAVDLETGMIIYHRASFDKKLGRQGILPVPVDVSGIAFMGDEALWLASSQGATRVIGEKVKTFIEADGLRSEILRGVVCTPGGMVYTASSRGLGSWDGETWTYPPELRTAINDITMGNDGRLWLATDRGLGVYDGALVRRLDTRRGLLENRLVDVEADKFGRIWAMSESGLVLVSP